jgi:heme oxygenase-like protein
MTMETKQLIDVFETEGRLLDATLRHHPRLRALFGHTRAGFDREALKQSYLLLLKLKADYVRFTVPALRAAGEALQGGDAEDRGWSELFLGYAAGETDSDGDYGHQVWALDDMRALGAPKELLEAPPAASAIAYGRFFVDDAARHPYAILGAKGVLEHFSIRVSDDLVSGILDSGIEGAERAVTFFKHHGVLDIDHVRQGDRNLERLGDARKRFGVLEGAYFASGAYRSLVHEALPT